MVMHSRLMIAIAALWLTSAAPAMAQQSPAAPAETTTPTLGSIDFGFRVSSTDGDKARFERYRDLRNGAYSRISFGKDTDAYTFTAKVDNIGYRDQRYQVNYNNSGRVRFTALWDSTPLNYGYNTSTPWVEQSPGVFTLDPAARLLVQNNAPGVIGIPGNAVQLLTPSIYRGLAKPFDIQ